MTPARFDNFSRVGSNKGDLADWQHAARLYIDGNMRLAPKVKYLYHVVLNINPGADIPAIGSNQKTEINLLAKSADLPRYRVDTAVVNQYNRKKILQTGVEYQPINIEFHDDNSGLTTLLWESYFRYYYADSDYTKRTGNNPNINADAYKRISQGKNRVYGGSSDNTFRYGLDRSEKFEPFFSSIQIFQLHPQDGRSTFTAFTLINPIIVNFEHDQMDYSLSEFVLNRISFQYESVQYNRGETQAGVTPAGFGDRLYDTTPSSLDTLGSTGTSNRPIAGINNSSDNFARRSTISSTDQATLEINRRAGFATSNTTTSTNTQSANGYTFNGNDTANNSTEARPSNIRQESNSSSVKFKIKGYNKSIAEDTPEWQNFYENRLKKYPGYPDNVKRSLQRRARDYAHLKFRSGLADGSITPPDGVVESITPTN